jgi:hypothetical protein
MDREFACAHGDVGRRPFWVESSRLLQYTAGPGTDEILVDLARRCVRA